MELEYNEQALAMRGDIAVKDLIGSLDQWILYLSDPQEPYEPWFRYYTFRSILKLGKFDIDKGEFPQRSAGTNFLFPDIDRSALAYMQDIIIAASDPSALDRIRQIQVDTGVPVEQILTQEKALAFSKLPFATQYAQAIQKRGEITPELRIETRGEWRKFPKGSDPTLLWASLQNKGTPWCTAGYATATSQLDTGDFYIYFTLDSQGNPTIPRIAVRMQDEVISEIRGVADNNQNLEENMIPIMKEKISTDQLPGFEVYLKRTEDMKRVTAIGKKIAKGDDLTQDDLRFLYEIDSPIEGFGVQKDPRIADLKASRNLSEDAAIIMGLEPSQIAVTASDIGLETKVYIGVLEPVIFIRLTQAHVEHIYTSFPEGEIR